jgi:2-oxoglutarate dehydrogenase complex dihydrolipoamide succinyltransferase (E2) component
MSSSATDTTVAVSMPQMGISVSEGTILEWRKSVGDQVEADETICDVTTDKVDVEIPCPATGVLARIVAEPGDTVPVGEPIAEIDTGGGGAATSPDEPANGAEAARNGADASPEGDRSGFISPVVRRMADEHHVDLSQVEGHGVGGRIRKKDLIEHLETAEEKPEKPSRPLHTESPYVPDAPAPAADAPAPAANGGEGLREPMSPMRKAIAEHMVRSVQTAAHCTTIVEVDFSGVAKRRAELKPSFAEKGVPLTYLAFVARAVVESLEEFPALNASVDGDDIVRHPDVNLGIAVSLDAGLIVPVIPKAQRLSLEGIAAAIADVAGRARDGKLAPDEVQGGTFTITNPGQFGAVLATPIINQPQVGILDLEAIVKRPVVIESDAGDSIGIRPMGFLPMSWDHRALDGAEAARFLGSVKARLEGGVV